ncbi:hypothetical protein pipiens_015197 [Culex pipiens pipiens]|uniref:Uncharacterized protein n=1 Tax=Culex pipiens pipiens TaxID=38569 RepID=A0ABD1CRH5_CULPP
MVPLQPPPLQPPVTTGEVEYWSHLRVSAWRPAEHNIVKEPSPGHRTASAPVGLSTGYNSSTARICPRELSETECEGLRLPGKSRWAVASNRWRIGPWPLQSGLSVSHKARSAPAHGP